MNASHKVKGIELHARFVCYIPNSWVFYFFLLSYCFSLVLFILDWWTWNDGLRKLRFFFLFSLYKIRFKWNKKKTKNRKKRNDDSHHDFSSFFVSINLLRWAISWCGYGLLLRLVVKYQIYCLYWLYWPICLKVSILLDERKKPFLGIYWTIAIVLQMLSVYCIARILSHIN